MSGIDIQLIAAEMQRYVVQNRNVVKADFARATTVRIDSYARKVTKIKGAYQVLNSLMTHVVQGFKPEWQELGEFSVRDKELKNYHQKVNFGFVPADVLGTFLADWYEEDKAPTNKEIAKKIFDWLFTQINDDVDLLSFIGQYDQANASGQFGFSLKGLNAIVTDMLGNTQRPCFKIPLTKFTDVNVIDQIKAFEKGLPILFKNKIKEIHVSENVLEMYEDAYFNEYGHYPRFKDSDLTKTPLKKRKLIGWDGLDDDIIFATIDGNLLNLIDINLPNTITDVQVQDYKVKVFGEFWKGWDFLINEAVCVGNFADDVRGLGDDDLMKMYFPRDYYKENPIEPIPTPESIAVTPATATVEPGNSQTFAAAVTPAEANQDVVWSIESGTGLSINSNGVVTTTAGTEEGDYTVTATSVADDQVTGTATLTVSN